MNSLINSVLNNVKTIWNLNLFLCWRYAIKVLNKVEYVDMVLYCSLLTICSNISWTAPRRVWGEHFWLRNNNLLCFNDTWKFPIPLQSSLLTIKSIKSQGLSIGSKFVAVTKISCYKINGQHKLQSRNNT